MDTSEICIVWRMERVEHYLESRRTSIFESTLATRPIYVHVRYGYVKVRQGKNREQDTTVIIVLVKLVCM